MATKKTTKSSKTAHVLNVLSNTPTDAEVAETDAPDTAARPVRPPVLEVTKSEDNLLADQIHDSLIQDLEGLLPGSDPLPSTFETPSVAAAPSVSPDPVMPAAPIAAAAPAAPAAPVTPTPVRPVTVTTEAAVPSAVVLPGDVLYVNVMQALVEEKAPRYFKMFDMCTCSRCSADVKSIALTNLPPKYAVLKKDDEIPMLTFYEGRFSTEITAQIISACKLVMQHPRH